MHQNWTLEDWSGLPGLMSLSFCRDIQTVRSEQHEVNNMKAWIHPAQTAACGVTMQRIFLWCTFGPLVSLTRFDLDSNADIKIKSSDLFCSLMFLSQSRLKCHNLSREQRGRQANKQSLFQNHFPSTVSFSPQVCCLPQFSLFHIGVSPQIHKHLLQRVIGKSKSKTAFSFFLN